MDGGDLLVLLCYCNSGIGLFLKKVLNFFHVLREMSGIPFHWRRKSFLAVSMRYFVVVTGLVWSGGP